MLLRAVSLVLCVGDMQKQVGVLACRQSLLGSTVLHTCVPRCGRGSRRRPPQIAACTGCQLLPGIQAAQTMTGLLV